VIAIIVGFFSILGYFSTTQLINEQLDEFKPNGDICAIFGLENIPVSCPKGFIENINDYEIPDHINKKSVINFTLFTQIVNKGRVPLELIRIDAYSNCTKKFQGRTKQYFYKGEYLIEPYASKTFYFELNLVQDDDNLIETPCLIEGVIETNFGEFYPKRRIIK
jgi:hypothetical protein